jgi:hypothetical protein
MIYGLVFMVPIAPFAIFGVVFNRLSGRGTELSLED